MGIVVYGSPYITVPHYFLESAQIHSTSGAFVLTLCCTLVNISKQEITCKENPNMPLYTVAKLRDHTFCWILTHPEHDQVYEESDRVLSYTRVTAIDGPTAVAFAAPRFNGYREGKLACNKKSGHKARISPKNLDEETIIQALYRNWWSVPKAAKDLGIHVDSLYKLMKKFYIPVKAEKRST